MKIQYLVLFGDSLGAIAVKFNSTVEAIRKENNLTNENDISAGMILTIPVNLVTPVPTKAPTAATTPTPGPSPTSTRAP
jgi:LysM repeat protein